LQNRASKSGKLFNSEQIKQMNEQMKASEKHAAAEMKRFSHSNGIE
jgi:hypothetical protein